MNQYETVFILTPVLSDDQMKEAVNKFKGVLTKAGAEIISEENWGLKIYIPHLINTENLLLKITAVEVELMSI